MIYILIENEKYYNEIYYIFHYIFEYVYGLQGKYEIYSYRNAALTKGDLLISYGSKQYTSIGKNKEWLPNIHIYETDILWKCFWETSTLISTPLNRYFGEEAKDLPILFKGNIKVDNYIEYANKNIRTSIDIIASSFYLLSRYEEYVIKDRDQHGRFSAMTGFCYREKILERPVVNEYFELLWIWINKLTTNFTKRNYWGNKEFAFFLSHDIDHLYKYNRAKDYLHAAKKAATDNQHNKYSLLKELLKALQGEDPYYKFNEMLELEKNYNIKSSWYFMVSKRCQRDGTNYNIGDLSSIIANIKEKGHEVGLHLSYNSYNNLSVLQEEVEIFKEKTGIKRGKYGVRQHFLRIDPKITWEIQEKQDILYDTTLGYADNIGFRAGICYPFKPYNFKRRRSYDLWEIPLLVMDGTLKSYSDIDLKEAYSRISRMVSYVKSYKGVFSLLWHNSSLDSSWTYWRKLYKMILNDMQHSHALCESGENIIKLFNCEGGK